MYDAGPGGEGFGGAGYAMGYSAAQQAEWKQRIIDDEQLRLAFGIEPRERDARAVG